MQVITGRARPLRGAKSRAERFGSAERSPGAAGECARRVGFPPGASEERLQADPAVIHSNASK